MNKLKFLLLAVFLSEAIGTQGQTAKALGTGGNQFNSYSVASNNRNYIYASDAVFSERFNNVEPAVRNNIPELLRKPLNNEIKIERYKTITMRDGVKLYADVYLPAAPGKYPTIVIRTCYGVQRDGGHQDKIRFAQEGYAVVFADIRGRYESEGNWDPFRDESKDGYDVIEWAAAQPFSNGKVATQGGNECNASAFGSSISRSSLNQYLC